MTKYRLIFKKSVAKDLRDLPMKDIARILKCFGAIAENPRGPGCEKLSGLERYRVRRGIYRIIYEIHDEVLIVVSCHHPLRLILTQSHGDTKKVLECITLEDAHAYRRYEPSDV